MAGVAKRSDLVVSLATVAISALTGPLGAVGVAAAKELVKTCQAAWDRNSPQRQLRDAVQQSIETWAKHQEIPSETIDRGLGWAVEWVQAAGSQYDLIAEADFDPDKATAAVLAHIKRSEGRYYGTEDEYTVAERAVAATYRTLCNQLKSDGGTVLAAIQATRHAIVASIEGLRAELKGYADRDELIRYLRARIQEWDFSPVDPRQKPLPAGAHAAAQHRRRQKRTPDGIGRIDRCLVLSGTGWTRFGQDVAGSAICPRSSRGCADATSGPQGGPGIGRDPTVHNLCGLGRATRRRDRRVGHRSPPVGTRGADTTISVEAGCPGIGGR